MLKQKSQKVIAQDLYKQWEQVWLQNVRKFDKSHILKDTDTTAGFNALIFIVQTSYTLFL